MSQIMSSRRYSVLSALLGIGASDVTLMLRGNNDCTVSLWGLNFLKEAQIDRPKVVFPHKGFQLFQNSSGINILVIAVMDISPQLTDLDAGLQNAVLLIQQVLMLLKRKPQG